MNNSAGLTKAQLKDKVRAIVLLQGNDFIKELLRQNSIKIGVNKKDFAENIAEAIDRETLTQAMIDDWLYEIEGWGNQHVYLFQAPAIQTDGVSALLAASGYAGLVGAAQNYDFPDALELSNILHDAQGLSLVWHLGKEGWDRTKFKDFQQSEGLELYRFEAYRRRRDRSVVRFDWRFADPHCAILIHRNKEIDHAEALNVVWEVLKTLAIIGAPRGRFSLTEAVKSASKEKGTKSARLETDGGFVDLVSTMEVGGIDQVEAVRHARHAMNDEEFARAQGIFSLGESENLAQSMSVQVYGSEGRIRLWAQCKRDDVHAVIAYLMKHNSKADANA
ncbi:hypothetical protein [Rhizobium ruizarguesonis]|uniref:hypothetical protein n=1 Tax=Rhizobium ruizarguesonis TaxID=2081791 RepID=UPI001032238F|nr:hypothetical protein [Rhizobium ruizarguesonis]TAV19044.1 hypothetical protein ELI35_37685 [Rhizobium ruizarguesonis]